MTRRPCDQPWEELTKGERKHAVKKIGFRKETWNSDDWSCITHGKWCQLLAPVKEAAKKLGFTRKNWKARGRVPDNQRCKRGHRDYGSGSAAKSQLSSQHYPRGVVRREEGSAEAWRIDTTPTSWPGREEEDWRRALRESLVGGSAFAPRSSSQQELATALADAQAKVVFALGPAGTGKTLLSVYEGLVQLAAGKVDRVLLLRPAVCSGGEDIGFLPGSVDSKLAPFALPAMEAIDRLTGRAGMAAALQKCGAVAVDALAFLRGRSLHRTFAIADEMQNARFEQLKCLLTRLECESGTKLCVLGDPAQGDLLPLGQGTGAPSGVRCAFQCFADEVSRAREPGLRCVRMGVMDVQRGPIVKAVLEMCERIEAGIVDAQRE